MSVEVLDNEIQLKDFDKSSWPTYRFDQIAAKVTERVDPTETDLDVYVGLKHLDPNTIHLDRHGSSDDVKGSKLRFYPGDVIFARRRAYQRKAVVAKCHGFCSAHALVLRAKPDVIEPDLFPFFMHSDQFMHQAIDISVGSLSPTINWGTLKTQGFILPPSDVQNKLVNLLSSLDELISKNNTVLNKYENFFRSSHNKLVSQEDKSFSTYKLDELGNFFNGLSGKSKEDFGEGKPYIPYMNIFSNSEVDLNHLDYVEVDSGENQNQVKYGDIFFTGSSETADEAGMSSVLLENISECYLNSFCFGFRLNDFKTLLPEYARFVFRGKEIRNFMSKHAQGSTRFNLSKSILRKKCKISIPSVNRQKHIAYKLDGMFQTSKEIEKNISITKKMQVLIINKIF